MPGCTYAKTLQIQGLEGFRYVDEKGLQAEQLRPFDCLLAQARLFQSFGFLRTAVQRR